MTQDDASRIQSTQVCEDFNLYMRIDSVDDYQQASIGNRW